jgi:hypothetical protein
VEIAERAMNKGTAPYNILMCRLNRLNTQGGTGNKSGIFEILDHHACDEGSPENIWRDEILGMTMMALNPEKKWEQLCISFITREFSQLLD